MWQVYTYCMNYGNPVFNRISSDKGSGEWKTLSWVSFDATEIFHVSAPYRPMNHTDRVVTFMRRLFSPFNNPSRA